MIDAGGMDNSSWGCGDIPLCGTQMISRAGVVEKVHLSIPLRGMLSAV